MPTRRRTWSAQGLTPYLHYSFRRDKLSALAALTVSPRRHRLGLHLGFQKANVTAPHAAGFLEDLLRDLRGPLIVLWDGASVHKGAPIQRVLARHPRLHLEYFPGYAPELNPAEQVWNELKGRTANGDPQNVACLRSTLHNHRRRLRSSQAKLRSFIAISDLPTPPC